MTLAALLLAAWSSAAQPASSDHQVVGGVVRSKEWVIRRAPKREEEFIGDVGYRKGPDTFNSDWALFRHEEQAWQARGHVRLLHTLASGARLEVLGDRAEYSQKTERGYLVGSAGQPVSFERFPLEGLADSGSARRLEWEGQRHVALSGDVRVWGPRLALWGDATDYDAAAAALTLSGGRPVLRTLEGEWTGAVQADKITAKDKPERVFADGRTRGWIRFKEKQLEKLGKLSQ